MEGSRLTRNQTRYIFETNTVGVENEVLNVDDVIETVNHFRCIDLVIDHADDILSEKFIKKLHLTLKMELAILEKRGLQWESIGKYLMKWVAWILLCLKKLPIR